MPRAGFKSITVKEAVYDYFFKKYQENQKYYQLEYGITSFGGFVTWLLKRMLDMEEGEEQVVVARFEYLTTQDGCALISDRKMGVCVEVCPQPSGELWCKHCESEDCEHTRFAGTIPQVKIIERLRKEKGGKLE